MKGFWVFGLVVSLGTVQLFGKGSFENSAVDNKGE